MPTIRIPTPLRQYTDGAAEIAVEGADVGAALNALAAQHPALRTNLFTDGGELRAFVNIFLNDEDVRHLQGLATALQSNDQLRIIPSIAGGTLTEAPAVCTPPTLPAVQAGQGVVRGLRLTLTVDDLEGALTLYRDVLGLPVEREWQRLSGSGAALTLTGVTLELHSRAQADFVDHVEVGRRTPAVVRMAVEVDDAQEIATHINQHVPVAALHPAVDTPWGQRNVRIETSEGVQLTLFSILNDAEADS
jgi:molybdopterin converting factor small subunit/catechol 2,3-dioxygenase-like lactoylglutathione lyase family enzyme